MSLASRVEELLKPVLDEAARLDSNTFVQAAIGTTLGPAAQSIVSRLIADLEAWEAAHETDKQAAVATAYQTGAADAQAAQTVQDPPPAEG